MKDEYMEAFAKRLYELRQLTGKSARDMSLSLGQSHNYINELELGRNYPAMKTFFLICEYLGVTPQEFFAYSIENPKQNQELLKQFEKLDAKSKAYFLNLMDGVNHRPK